MTGFDIAMAWLLSFGQVMPSAQREIVKHAGLQVVHADGAVTLRLKETGRTETAVEGGRLSTVNLKDEYYPVYVTRYVKTWNDCDAVETWYEVRHDEEGPVRILRADSFASKIDCKADVVKVLTLTGVWGREANLSEATVANGQIAQFRSLAGTRDAWESNPAMMVSFRDNVDEERGKVLGVALEWTGTTEKRVRRSWNGGATEVFIGVDMETGPYVLDPGKTFTTPKAILVWSEKGRGEVSRQFHRWARRHLMPHGDMLRPVLLNTWYGAYFNFTEQTLIDMMDGVKDMGAEMLVIDDGWFGKGKYARDDKNRDKTGLGDWVVNEEKLPHGLGWLADEAAKRGFKFGLWVEPEMCNVKSWLAEAHPDWILREENRALLFGRGGSQVTLDFTNPAVRDNIFAQLDAVYSSIPALAYIKWDCNQNIVNPGSTYLKPDRQANLWYDYTIGLYDLLSKFQTKRPHIMTQACASGGGHMDFGFLRYADEFWTSDITDPYRRIFIQWGSTQFYPAGAMACDVTRGGANLKYGLDVAMTGRLGISLHPKNLSSSDVALAKAAVNDYKRIRPIVQCGDLYRLVSPYGGKMAALMYVSEDKSGAALFALGLNGNIVAEETLRLRGLDPDATYAVAEINKGATLHAEFPTLPRTGCDLMEKGIRVKLSGKFDSAAFEVRRVGGVVSSPHGAPATHTVWFDEMDLSGMGCGWGKPMKNRSIVGKALRPGGTAFKRGVGTHAVSHYEIDCDGKVLAFDAMVGVDAAAGKDLGSVKFVVDADGKRVAESPVMHAGTPPYPLHADLSGAKVVELSACDTGDGITYDHADWCDARFTVIDGATIKPFK
ncbi:MAG: alpha-galactosidase [Kiritimatiellae bacterium]|nr:alpha-galactosidase [Kiritimatiellia bacterium]